MRKFILKGLVALVFPALLSCGSREQTEYHGDLYFGQGSYLMRLSLRDGGLSVVDNLGDKTIRDISAFGKGRLLVAETASINRRTVTRISWIDLKTTQATALYSGVLARFLPAAGVIVYDDGSKMYAVSLRNPGEDEILFSHGLNQLATITAVSEDTLLFETDEAEQPVIHSWNAVTGELLRLDSLTAACRLSGAVWIDTLERLACKRRGSKQVDAGYVLADLQGAVDGKLNLPEGRQFEAVAYVATQNAVILKEAWRSWFGTQQKSAVWIHNLQSSESHRLARNLNLGSSVVYTEF